MRILSVVSILAMVFFVACGNNDAGEEAGASTTSSSEESDASVFTAGSEDVQGDIQQDGIEGRWQRQDGTILVFEAGTMKTLAQNEVELRSETYEMAEKSPCTEEENGPYLVVKGGATTCWQLLRLDADSMFITLTSARPAVRYWRIP